MVFLPGDTFLKNEIGGSGTKYRGASGKGRGRGLKSSPCFPQLSVKKPRERLQNNTAFSIRSDGGGQGGREEREREGGRANSSETPWNQSGIITQARARVRHRNTKGGMTEEEEKTRGGRGEEEERKRSEARPGVS